MQNNKRGCQSPGINDGQGKEQAESHSGIFEGAALLGDTLIPLWIQSSALVIDCKSFLVPCRELA